MVELKRHRQSKEHIEQVKFVGYIKLFHPEYIIFSVPNGSAVSAAQRIKLAKEGMTAGVPDLFIVSPSGRWLGVEMKRAKGGVVSEAQKQVKERLMGCGVTCAVCDGYDAAKQAFVEFYDKAKDN